MVRIEQMAYDAHFKGTVYKPATRAEREAARAHVQELLTLVQHRLGADAAAETTAKMLRLQRWLNLQEEEDEDEDENEKEERELRMSEVSFAAPRLWGLIENAQAGE